MRSSRRSRRYGRLSFTGRSVLVMAAIRLPRRSNWVSATKVAIGTALNRSMVSRATCISVWTAAFRFHDRRAPLPGHRVASSLTMGFGCWVGRQVFAPSKCIEKLFFLILHRRDRYEYDSGRHIAENWPTCHLADKVGW